MYIKKIKNKKGPNIILRFLLQGLVLFWISAKSKQHRPGFELGNFYLRAVLMTLGKSGSPLGMFGRVLKATVCKWHLRYPHTESEFNWQNAPRQYCKNHNGQILLLPNVPLLR